MKKIYDVATMLDIPKFTNGYDSTSIWNHFVFMDEETVKSLSFEKTFTSFQELYDFINAGYIPNAEADFTFFRNRKQIHLSTAGKDFQYTMTEKTFRPCSVKRVFTECKPTFSTLMESLPSEDFIEYCIDRGITVLTKQ